MIKKLKSIIDGNGFDVINLKIKRKLNKKKIHNVIVKNYKEIPIVINNRNRLYFLKKLLNFLLENQYTNIIILDNQSTYLPLIEFYKNINCPVIRLQYNYGYLALWKSQLFEKLKNNYYVYTDPDVIPISNCPHDFLDFFLDSLNTHKYLEKIGFGIKINDLEVNNIDKKNIISNENKFWKKKLSNSNLYIAPIDTTFALYKPGTFGGYWLNSARSDYPYLIHHLPWYDDTDIEEDIFYKKNISKKSSFYLSKRYEKY